MDTRDLYRQKFEAQLREWNAKVEEIKAHADKLNAQARLDMQPHVDTVRQKYEATKSKFQDMSSAADDTWEEMKRNAEQAWSDFKSEIEGAYDALKSHSKSKH